mmetsp:Transcript_44942/g.107437  ORF Transcript_44942/g.107437 Transcript_44942/m.107437 type:complete len:391 (+) Transcript_44942:442-1614(+)
MPSSSGSEALVSCSLQGLNCTVPLTEISWITLNTTRPWLSPPCPFPEKVEPKPAARRRCRGTPCFTSSSRTRLARSVLRESASPGRVWPSTQSLTPSWRRMTLTTPCTARVAKDDMAAEPVPKVTRCRTSTSTSVTATAPASRAEAKMGSGSGSEGAVRACNSSASASAALAFRRKSSASMREASAAACAAASARRTSSMAASNDASSAEDASHCACALAALASASAIPASRRVCAQRIWESTQRKSAPTALEAYETASMVSRSPSPRSEADDDAFVPRRKRCAALRIAAEFRLRSLCPASCTPEVSLDFRPLDPLPVACPSADAPLLPPWPWLSVPPAGCKATCCSILCASSGKATSGWTPSEGNISVSLRSRSSLESMGTSRSFQGTS